MNVYEETLAQGPIAEAKHEAPQHIIKSVTWLMCNTPENIEPKQISAT